MAMQSEQVGHSELVDGSETTLHSHAGGGGSSPKVFQAVKTGTGGISSSLATVDFEDVQIIDTSNFSESGGEVTILVAGRYEISTYIASYGGSNRVEIEAELQVNGTSVLISHNYASRNTTQRRGGVWFTPLVKQLSVNDVVRVQARYIGTASTFMNKGGSLMIRSL
jgi:hypothetical protein